jgi:hypothetical protein
MLSHAVAPKQQILHAPKRNLDLVQLCRGKPPASPTLSLVAQLAPLWRSSFSPDEAVRRMLCWALSYMFDGPNREDLQAAIIESGALSLGGTVVESESGGGGLRR